MDIRRQIAALVGRYPLVVFMQGTPEYPMSAGAARVVDALNAARVPFHAVDVQRDPFLRAGLPRLANWFEFPQVYLQGDLVGGCDVVLDLLQSGELARMARDLAQVEA